MNSATFSKEPARGVPDLSAAVAFVVVFASLFRIESAFGVLIAFDIFALIAIAINAPSFFRMSNALLLWPIVAAVTISGLVSIAVIGVNEFGFLSRLLLTLLDGMALALLVRPDRSNFTAILQAAAAAYAFGFVLFLVSPAFAAVADLPSVKAWVAVAPVLLVLITHVRGSRNSQVVVLGLVVLIALVFQSRTLLITTLLFIIYVYLKTSLAWKIVGSVLILGLGLLLLEQMENLVAAQEHSNSFRSAMIMQIFSFSYEELLFGRGIDNWRIQGLRELIHLPGAASFFESANPHFLPAEIIIRGGLTLLTILALFCMRLARRSQTWVLGGIMIAGSFFTTNTGSERLIPSIGLFIVIVGAYQFPMWRGVRPLPASAPSGSAAINARRPRALAQGTDHPR
jgi:hypothetical protein